MAEDRLEVVLGAGNIGPSKYPDVESAQKYCEMFRPYGKRIDHARIYPTDAPGQAEELMKASGVSPWARMDSKVTAIGDKEHSKEYIAASIDQSLKALGVESLDIFYLHMPDGQTPFEESMEAVDRQHKAGKFKRLGLSNQSPSQAATILHPGYIKPSVYQGHYKPVCRKAETTLLPILRKHGISFFAFAPSGVGIFSGNVNADSIHNPDLRWSNKTPIGKFWSDVYFRPQNLEAAERVRKEAEEVGLNGHHAALRWVLHHSALKRELGDAMIIGSSTFEQREGNLGACDAGPLPTKLASTIDGIWEGVQDIAPWAWIGDLSEDVRKDFESRGSE